MNAPDNENSLNALPRGHEEFLELYRQMLAVAISKMKNRADALDVVQEAWLKIFIKRDSLRDPNKLAQWAKTIVSNTANTAIRRKMVYQDILREQVETIYANVREAAIDRHMERQELLHLIDRLEKDTRNMFLLKFYCGWKDEEIADALGLPVGTVKARIHRGKKQLRSWMEGAGLPGEGQE